jgi:septal ring factor EnvC (AmiA/AmiB activator)
MTSEEMERTIQFILEQQAQLTATVGRLSERVDQIAVKVDRNADGIASLLAIAEIHDREIRAVDERQRATDERLNALINTVERYINEGREGKSS